MIRAFYPGSFDPPTNGHLDIIRRLATMFDEVFVGVGHNHKKSGWLPVEERVALLVRLTEEDPLLENVRVVQFSGLAVECAGRIKATLVVKGIRDNADLAAEEIQAVINRDLAGYETLFILSDPAWRNISSSSVRELVAFDAPIERYVPGPVAASIAERGSGRGSESKP